MRLPWCDLVSWKADPGLRGKCAIIQGFLCFIAVPCHICLQKKFLLTNQNTHHSPISCGTARCVLTCSKSSTCCVTCFKRHNFTYSVTHFETFLTFSKNRQMRPDLPNTSVTKISVATLSLCDLWRIIIGRHNADSDVPIIQTATAKCNIRLLQMNSHGNPKWDFLLALGPFGNFGHLQHKALKQVHYSWTLCKTWRQSTGSYLTEINYRGFRYSPGDLFQSQKMKVLRESITHGYWQKTMQHRPVGEIIKGDFYCESSVGKIKRKKSRDWELRVHYLLYKYFILHFKIFKMW